MSEYLYTIFMALFQGIAEFLPISSSGHLELLGALFGIAEDERFTLSIVLHAGTLSAMLAFYFKDIIALFIRRQWRVIGAVIIGSVPAGIGGVALKLTGAESYLHCLVLTGICFMITGILLWGLKNIQQKATEYTALEKIPYSSALFIGFLQMIAILPGISRSGSTIFAGAKCRLAPEDNAKFSFLLAMAAIGGAALLEIISCLGKVDEAAHDLNIIHYGTGFVVSALCGYLALTLLLKLLKSKKLGYFGFYMFIIGIATIIYGIIK